MVERPVVGGVVVYRAARNAVVEEAVVNRAVAEAGRVRGGGDSVSCLPADGEMRSVTISERLHVIPVLGSSE